MIGINIAPLARLIEQFEKLPGIGAKSAQRLAYFILKLPNKEVQDFADAILDAKNKIVYCKKCCNLADDELCYICKNENRDKTTVCVVEDPRDIIAFERTKEYYGTYHVLHGVISPMNGIGPDNLHVKELLERVKSDKIREVIMATDPTVEGEATAMYISKLLMPLAVKVTRLAYGIPVGGDLEYADEITLTRALEGRTLI